MLGFLRKYQRYFYLVITVVIIISFSFFGTYSTLGSDNYHEQTAFTAIDGTAISRHELEQLVTFLSTDAEDKQLFGGVWGPNFLNDGVIKKDILQTGLAQQLIAQYPQEVAQDLDRRLEKEKKFTLYTHPQSPVVSVEMAWGYFAPEISPLFKTLQKQSRSTSESAFNTRVKLYLAQSKISAPTLRQLLLYQQQRNSSIKPDPNLPYADLSLFGYHTLDDWFGPRFLKLVGQFIINSSKIAEQRGYKVSKQEAFADLLRNADASYRNNLSNPNIGVANSREYLETQLHLLGLDQNKAAQLWRQVLLFRRLFQDVGQSIFVDPQSVQPFHSYASATVEGDLYQLPEELRFNNVRSLELFETYLNAVSKRPTLLDLPKNFLSVEEVQEKAPEFVQKRYLLDISYVNKKVLQGRVSVKETWDWEADEKNWEALANKFPFIAEKKAPTREERLSILDALEEPKRVEVDNFARQAIVDAHPEWLEKALQDAEPKRFPLALAKGSMIPLPGLKNPESLMQLLDKAKKGEQDPSLAAFTADQNSYFKIIVIDRSPQPEIVTFSEALKNGSLNRLLDQSPKPDNAALLKAIYESYAAGIAPEKAPSQLIDDVSASLRFFSYMQKALAGLKKTPESASNWVKEEKQEVDDQNKISLRPPLTDQWLLVKSAHREERKGEQGDIDLNFLFAMQPESWSSIQTPVSGNLHFFELKRKGQDNSVASLQTQVLATQSLVAKEAQTQLADQLLELIAAKEAISLDYLQAKEEEKVED